MKPVIVFYSLSGNTRKIAEAIQKKIGGDIAEIQTVTPYTGSYNAIVDQGQDEIRRGYSPAIKQLGVDLKNYDTVVIGTPVWWYTFAPAVKTFFEENDLSGKDVYPFATNGGWLGHTFDDVKKICKGANVKSGLNIHFNGSTLKTKEKEIEAWIDKIGG